MKNSKSRRNFMKAASAAGAGFWAAGGFTPKESLAAIEEIRFACIGVGGKGSSDSASAGQSGKVVGICDIDEERLNKAGERFKGAKKYFDYRKMLDENEKNIDAVTVSTPDHCHGVASAHALKMGKHCFTQKPLTRTIWEARRMGELATENNCMTQMGNQGTSHSGLREAAALIKGGAIGDIKEVHVWTNRPVWPQGIGEPEAEEAPSFIHWDEWIGPAKRRPYSSAYHPFKWRGFWDFGTGALGDMACHTLNMPFMGCELKDPTSVIATTSGHNKVTYPSWSQITFEFPKNDWRSALQLYWYDGGKLPEQSLFSDSERFAKKGLSKSGCLVVGTKGKIYSPNDYGADFEMVGGEKKDVDYKRSPGHFREFAMAIKTGKQSMSNFPGYAGPLTEVILLGNLAVFAADTADKQGDKINWDAKDLKVKGNDKYDWMVKPELLNGYTI